MRVPVRALASIVLLLSAILLSGCAEIPDAVQSRFSQPVGEIYGSRTVGQTFVAHENGLSRVDVLLATYARKNTHPVIFHLKESPGAADDIATIIFSAARVKDNAFHQFKFAPIPDSKGKSYFFALESPQSVPGDAITIWHEPEDIYDEGAMYVNGQPTNGDLAFRAYYGGLGDVISSVPRGLGRGVASLILGTLLFVVPGYALLVLLSPGEEFDFIHRLILAVGLSVALFPLVLYVSTNLGVSLDRVKVGGLLVVCGGISCWGLYRALRRGRIVRPCPDVNVRAEKTKPYGLRFSPAGALSFQHGGLAPCLLAFVFALSLVVRLLMIRGMPYPAWSDSYHHTIIAQMIAQRGMIPQSYEPYMPVEPFAYHFGFHAAVAFFHWLTGTSIPQAVLIVGQILNALSVLTIYFLAHYLTKDRWAALVSALVTGLVSVMPAYYVNWGRYPQLCGQVIFPVAAVLTIEYLKTSDVMASFSWRVRATHGARNRLDRRRSPTEAGRARSGDLRLSGTSGVIASAAKQSPVSFDGRRACPEPFDCAQDKPGKGASTEAEEARSRTIAPHVRSLLLAALAVVGLLLAHYRVLLFYGLFVALYVLGESWLARREPRKVGKLWLKALLLALLSLVIVAPWLRLLIGQFARKVQQARAHGFQLDPSYNLVTWDIITSLGLRPALLALAALGTLWGLWRRDKHAIVVAGWAVSLFILANPYWLGLPGAGLVNNGTVVMALYIPGSILAGFFVSYLNKAVRIDFGNLLRLPKSEGWFGYGLAVAVILVSLWGAGNMLQLLTPETFFVTPSDLEAMAWIRDHVPEDARFAINTHFWLSYAAIGTDAGYWIPYLTGRSTTVPPMLYSEGTYDYVGEVNALARATAGLCEGDDTLPTLVENGVTHVYIGQRGGCLRPQRLLASPNYEAIYHRDGVWVFEVKQ